MTNLLEGFSLFAKRWLPAVIWMSVIIFASSDVGSSSNSYRIIRPWLLQWNPKMPESEAYRITLMLRKTMHAVQFAVLAILVLRAQQMLTVPRKNRALRAIGFVFIVAFVLAAGSELIQYLMKSRGASVKDVFLNLSGTALGVIAAYLASVFKKRRAVLPPPEKNP